MALVVKDRVRETTTTTGTGTVTLGGAVAGFQAFSVIGNGNTTYYTISDPATGAWEVGIGTYTSSGTTLSRDTVLESSNSNNLVNFGAGTKDVFVTYPADRSVTSDVSTTFTAAQTFRAANAVRSEAAATQDAVVVAGRAGGTNSYAVTLTPTTLTASRTFTFPDADGTALYSGGPLGTPSSGTVTNLTGTASININGTVGATTPNTGAFTTLSASGVATFSAGTASAPAITTTGDTNNGIFFPATDATAITTAGSERVRVDSSGNVGIGTSSPGTSRLNIQTAAASTSALKISDATNYTLIAGYHASTVGYIGGDTGSSLSLYTNNSEKVRIDTSGNVGIGATTLNDKLTVATQAYSINMNYGIRLQSTGGELNYRLALKTDNLGVGRLAFDGYSGSGTVTERMAITDTGNVGIGTSSPGYKLVVADTNKIVDNPGNVYVYTTDSAAADKGAQLTLGGSYTGTVPAPFAGISGRYNGTAIGGYMSLSTLSAAGALTERLRIDSSGNVGIGRTPSTRLDVLYAGSAASLTANASAAFQAGVSGLSCLAVTVNPSSPYEVAFQARHNSVNDLSYPIVLNPLGGNVGIGTSSPGQLVEASKSQNGDTVIQVTNVNTGSGATAQFFASNGTTKTQFFHTGTNYSGGGVFASAAGAGGIYNDQAVGIILAAVNASGVIKFATGGTTERLRIDSSGNVIVNTAAIATTATDGFLYVPTCAGTPTGTPTTYTGRAPIVVDTTNNKLYFYSGGQWRDAGP